MDREERNRLRLRLLLKICQINISELSKSIKGVSRPLLSRILSGHLSGEKNKVYYKIEKSLENIISQRRQPFFEVDGVDIEQAENIVEQLRKIA